MTRMDCGCEPETAVVCLRHALPAQDGTCDHNPPEDVDGRYVSECCTAYAIGEVHDGDPKLGILPTGFCGDCRDHAVFARECAQCGEIVEFPR